MKSQEQSKNGIIIEGYLHLNNSPVSLRGAKPVEGRSNLLKDCFALLGLAMTQIRTSYLNNRVGFTLTEIMITVVIAGMFVGMGIPAYTKAMEHQKDRDAQLILQTLLGAQTIYKVKNGRFLESTDLDSINATLKINVTDLDWLIAVHDDVDITAELIANIPSSNCWYRIWDISSTGGIALVVPPSC